MFKEDRQNKSTPKEMDDDYLSKQGIIRCPEKGCNCLFVNEKDLNSHYEAWHKNNGLYWNSWQREKRSIR